MLTKLLGKVDVKVELEPQGGPCGKAHATRHALSMCLAPFVESDTRLEMKISKFMILLLQNNLKNDDQNIFTYCISTV